MYKRWYIKFNKTLENGLKEFDKILSGFDRKEEFLRKTDPTATVEPICIMDPEIPDAELRIKLDPKYHNRIAMIKNTGMKTLPALRRALLGRDFVVHCR